MPTSTEDDLVAITNARRHLDGREASLDEAARVRDEAHRVLASFPPVEAGRAAKIKLAVLQAEAAVEEADARWQECVDVLAAARTQWETLVRRAFADRQRTRLQAAHTAAQALVAELEEDLADRAAVAAALGCADGGDHPAPAAHQLVHAIQYAQRVLDPPVPSVPAPRPGMVRVKTLQPHWNPDASFGLKYGVGDVYDMHGDQVGGAVAQGLVEEVEA